MKINKKKLIVIVGPTASGKTSLSIKLAKKFKCGIISADSRQFYKEMSIGTAKPTSFELEEAPHFFINNLSVVDSYSVGKFIEQVNNFFEEYYKNNDIIILVGGSGLFIDGVLKGLDDFPEINDEIRNELNLDFDTKGIKNLCKRLKVVDPEYYDVVDLNNPRRVIRALEVYYSTNKPYSSFLSRDKTYRKDINIKLIGINPEREKLNLRIEIRVNDMINNGLVDEVKNLYDYKDYNALNTVGYTEIFKYIDGDISLDEAIDLIKLNTRKYSKRQMTWFRRNKEILWYKDGEGYFQDILDDLRF
ncbi:MAG: tRNA (adenosine(37)-N6)-dimethylallyltransferase MiaA [Flammeovirgaceae bacterium]|nr:tRNA (adenosine(37)-N6)-dimethylallyltransferase MiaA [Flammeovirgaceae bacterium]